MQRVPGLTHGLWTDPRCQSWVCSQVWLHRHEQFQSYPPNPHPLAPQISSWLFWLYHSFSTCQSLWTKSITPNCCQARAAIVIDNLHVVWVDRTRAGGLFSEEWASLLCERDSQITHKRNSSDQRHHGLCFTFIFFQSALIKTLVELKKVKV